MTPDSIAPQRRQNLIARIADAGDAIARATRRARGWGHFYRHFLVAEGAGEIALA